MAKQGLNKNEIIEKLNKYGANKKPILFIIDFDINKHHIYPLDNVPSNVLYKFGKFSNTKIKKNKHYTYLEKQPMQYSEYEQYFNQVQSNINQGNTYLLNLSFPTPIQLKQSTKEICLKNIFMNANSKFRLLFKDEFISFSPERFIKTKKNKIFTYPIKGTIDASIENAKEIILKDIKETAEHTMIVDLLRNDLGIIGSKIKVKKFRKVKKINAGEKELLQVSSKIQAKLETNWQDKLGEKIISLLPAGSISGTPKKKSVNIINNIENQHKQYKRGYFCGICGYFDGENIDSFVLIRFLQNENDKYTYKSGGGITSDSNPMKEYNEMIDKVYIPKKKSVF